MSTPSIEDLERAYKVVRAFTLAAQAYLMGERAEMVRSLDLAVRELEEHPVFTADNLDLLDGVGRVLDQSEIDRAHGNTVGARARRVVFANGAEGFDTLKPQKHPGRTFRDLPGI